MRKPRRVPALTSEQACAVLNAVEPGASYATISKRADVAPSTAFNVLKGLPLWGYVKNPKIVLDSTSTDVYEETS